MKPINCFILFLFVAFEHFGQVNQFIPYSHDQGLQSRFIYDICQDDKGNILLATENGLINYNGYQFNEILVKEQKERSFFNSFLLDSQNNIWIGNNRGQVWKRDSKGTIKKIEIPESFNSAIINFYEDYDGEIWISSKTNGIIKLSPTGAQNHYPFNSEIRILNSFQGISRKSFLIGSNEGLYLYRENLNKSLDLVKKIALIPQTKITFIGKENDYFWVGTIDEGLYKIALKKQDELEFELFTSYPELNKYSIKSAISSKNEVLWVSSTGDGLLRIKDNELVHFQESDGLSSESLSQLFKDKEENIWIGTLGKGLMRKYNSPFKPYSINGIEEQEIADIIDYNQEKFLAGSEGLYKSNGLTELVGANSLAQWQGKLFVSTRKNGIYLFNGKGFSLFENSVFQQNKINQILIKENQLYVATSTQGLIVMNLLDRSYEQFNTTNGLTHNEVNSCYVDSKERIWLAMSGGVLNAIEKGEIKIFGNEQGLHAFDFSEIDEDENGVIWISSNGGGLYSYSNNIFKNYSRSEGLHTNYLTSLCTDKKGNIWCAGRDGISRYSLDSEKFYSYNSKTNIYNFSISQKGLKSMGDSLVILGNKGVFLHDRDNDIQNTSSNKLSFTQVLINDSLFQFDKKIELANGKYSLAAKFQKISFTNQQEIQYRFYLDGQEDSYGPAFNDPSCYYPGLLSGDQKLKIISSDGNGNWDEEPLVLELSIDIPIYQKPYFILLCILGLIGIFTSYILYKEKRNKNIQNYLNTELDNRTAEVRSQKEELAEKNKEIEDSIIYAERIQKSMLPNSKLLTENTKDHFILFKPRDIVSGDFYWFTETKEHFIFAGADCTGHGVPGSMMSMICISELNKTIQIHKEVNPAEILKRVDHGVKIALHQNTDMQANDGMDIGLCVLEKKAKRILFSGAGRPCYFIQNDELHVIKGSRNHIGGAQEEEKSFEVHEIDVSNKTKIYLSSDGFVDQFGGPKGKKYMRKQFREMLSSEHTKSMSDQRDALNQSFQNWKGNLEQVDDVLVMGLEF